MDERGERTEQPTSRARERARERGDIPHSMELSSAGILLVGFLALFIAMSTWLETGREMFTLCFGNLRFNDLDGPTVAAIFRWVLSICFRMVWPVFLAVIFGGLLINLIQTKGNISSEKIKPKLTRLNPISNAKNLFSMRKVFDAFKSAVKIIIAVTIGYSVITARIDRITVAGLKGPTHYLDTFGIIALEVALKIVAAFLLLALLDYMYQRYEHEKKLKMTRQEVKEDYKQTEGDPLVKQRLKQRQRQIAMTRMLREVPQADVVVTNPVEVSVALKYEEGEPAPIVVAKGKGQIAERIRDLARQFDVTIYPDPPLARALYAACDVGDLVPFELYKAIAEVLAYVYSLKKNRKKARRA